MSTETISVEIIEETEKSWKCRIYGEVKFVPKSQIEKMQRIGDKASITVPGWLAEKLVDN